MNQPSVKTKPSDGSAPRDWRYHSTAENLILGRKSNPGQPQGLHYDDAYRLIGTTQGLALGIDTDDFVSDGTVGTVGTPNPGNWRSGYAYDAADNLTQASSETNPAGNWIATPNSLNQIASKGGNSWVYDAAGNLLDDGVRSYEWDAQQRLIALTDKATGRKSEFVYDGQSRLTVAKEYPAGSSTGQETRYLWCGHKVCQSRDGQDNVTARYFDEGEIKTSNTGSTALYYTKDHLGSIMETTQASGKVLGSLDYGPYGEAEKAQGQLPDFRYAGMLHHAPTGLYLTHYRAYDPTVARWLNRDPIEESGGINLYGYVGGNPASNIDPLGLSEVIYDGQAKTITVKDGNGSTVGVFPANNNTTITSKGSWPNGAFPYVYSNPHPESDANGAYGLHGIFVFDVPNRSGMGLHSGRANGRAQNHPTLGCIRTTDNAMEFLKSLVKTDPVTSITVKNNNPDAPKSGSQQ